MTRDGFDPRQPSAVADMVARLQGLVGFAHGMAVTARMDADRMETSRRARVEALAFHGAQMARRLGELVAYVPGLVDAAPMRSATRAMLEALATCSRSATTQNALIDAARKVDP